MPQRQLHRDGGRRQENQQERRRPRQRKRHLAPRRPRGLHFDWGLGRHLWCWGRHKGAAAGALLNEQSAGSQLLLLLLLSLPLLMLLLLSLYIHSLFLLFVTTSLGQQQFHRGSFRRFLPFCRAFVTFSFSSWGSPSLRASLERGSSFLVFAWRPPPPRIPFLGFFPPSPSTTYPGCRPFRPSLRLAS